MDRRFSSRRAAYLLAVLATVAVAVVRFALSGVLGDVAPFIPFLLSVTLAASVGGLWPGLLATGLGATAGVYLIASPSFDFRVGTPGFVGAGVFVVIGAAIAILCEKLYASRRSLESEQRIRRESEERERARRVEIEALMESVPAAVWIAEDAECRVIKGNRAAYQMMRSPQGANLSMSASPGERPTNLKCVRDGRELAGHELPMQTAGARGVDVRDAELSFVFDDGSVRHILGNAVPLRGADGGVRGVISAFVDITGRRETEESRRRWQFIFENAGWGMAVADPAANTLRHVNAAFARMHGYEVAELVGRPLADVFAPENRAEVIEHARRAHASGDYRYESTHLRKDGSRFPCETHVLAFRDAAGEVLFRAATFEDVSGRKAAEEVLREADRRKDEFLAILAHELRNPLAPVRNAIEILRMKGPPTPELQWARDVIDRQIQQMSRLIDDLLDVSRITRDKLEIHREPVELARVLHGAVETSRSHVDRANQALSVSLPAEAVHVDGDLVRLGQVFSNLLHNASKFSPPGGRIDVAAERRGGEVVVAVRDDGIGIPREMLTRIFEPFMQLDQGFERSRGGLGIGLTLAKRIVEMHGGSLEARSEGAGKGTEFVVRLPVASPDRIRAAVAGGGGDGHRSILSRRILVADDREDCATSLSLMLRLVGHDVRTALDGDAALTTAESFRPDVALLDVGMPKLNGYDVARRIREQSWGRAMKLVAVTGWGQERDRRRSLEAGFDRHLVKPIEPADLEKLLASLAPDAAPSLVGAPSPDATPSPDAAPTLDGAPSHDEARPLAPPPPLG